MTTIPLTPAGTAATTVTRHAAALSSPLPGLRRVQWAVRATLLLGVAASVAANVLHAQPNAISQAIAAWPPLALLLTVELISRVPVHRPLLAAARLAATVTISGIAALVSYRHMVEVAVRYGEADIVAYLLPLSVDGLVVVASISLVELAGRIRTAEPSALADVGPPSPESHRPAPSSADPPHGQALPNTQRAVVSSGIADTVEEAGADRGSHQHQDDPDGESGGADPAVHDAPDSGDEETRRGDDTGDRRADERDDEPPAATAAAVAYWLGKEPSLQPADVAAKIGRSYRTVRRHWPSR